MPHIVQDRILESTTSTGTGNIALAAAITGFRRFNAVCAVGDTVPYFIEAIDATGLPSGEYEYGIATYSSANTLTRTAVLGSSNADALVNFSTGSKNVGTAALGRDLMPTGMLGEFLGATAPAGWLERNGSLVSRAQYPALWSHAQASGVITATDAAWVAGDNGKFSPGDGATTFRLPDHRGEFMRAWDHGRGVDAGRAIGSPQAHLTASHNHPAKASLAGYTGGNGAFAYAAGDNNGFGDVGGGGATFGVQAVGGSETRPRNIAVLACIKT